MVNDTHTRRRRRSVSVCESVCMSVSLSVCLSVSICLSVCLSVSAPVLVVLRPIFIGPSPCYCRWVGTVLRGSTLQAVGLSVCLFRLQHCSDNDNKAYSDNKDKFCVQVYLYHSSTLTGRGGCVCGCTYRCDCCASYCRFLSASLYFSKRGAY